MPNIYGPGPFKSVPPTATDEVPAGTHGLMQEGQSLGWLLSDASSDTWIWPGAGWQTFSLGPAQLGAPSGGTVYAAGVLAAPSPFTFTYSAGGAPGQSEGRVGLNGNCWIHRVVLNGTPVGWFTRWVNGITGGGQLDWYIDPQFVQGGLLALPEGQTLEFIYQPQSGNNDPSVLPTNGQYCHLRQTPQ